MCVKGNRDDLSTDHQQKYVTAGLIEWHLSLLGYYSTLRIAEQVALLHGFIEFVSQLIDPAHERLVCVFNRVCCSLFDMLPGQLGDKHNAICLTHT